MPFPLPEPEPDPDPEPEPEQTPFTTTCPTAQQTPPTEARPLVQVRQFPMRSMVRQ